MLTALPASSDLLVMEQWLLVHYLLTLDFPRTLPSSSVTVMPWMSSFCLIMGMLMQLAAATAVKGTHRRTMGGALCGWNQRSFISCLHSPELTGSDPVHGTWKAERHRHSLGGAHALATGAMEVTL